MILLLFISFIITYGTWFIIHTYYAPYHLPAYLTFLSPRIWPWVSDIPTGPFQQWIALPIVTGILAACIYLGFVLSKTQKISFRVFCLILYVLCLVEVISFLYLTPNGIGHIALQAKSVMNIIWLPIHSLINFHPEFRNLSMLNKVRYIFTVWGATYATPTYQGSTHPPMFTVIGFALYLVSKYLFTPLQSFLTVNGIHYIAFGWGVIVTLINATLIIIVSYIAKIIFSEKIGRLTGVMGLTLPFVLFFVNAVMEGIPTVFLAAGILLLLLTAQYFARKNVKPGKTVSFGLAIGVCFIIAAQFSYGFAVPISSFLLCFSTLLFSMNRKQLFILFAGIALPAFAYFVFEYFISSGQSFWILRSFSITGHLNTLLDTFRPYPVSQISNFVVMSVMGGILWLPVVITCAIYSLKRLVIMIKPDAVNPDNTPPVRRYYIVAVSLCFLYLLLQKAVRLEVERTWFWFFFPAWALAGLYIGPWSRYVKQKISKYIRIPINNPFIYLLAIQAIISIILATQIQDYY